MGEACDANAAGVEKALIAYIAPDKEHCICLCLHHAEEHDEALKDQGWTPVRMPDGK